MALEHINHLDVKYRISKPIQLINWQLTHFLTLNKGTPINVLRLAKKLSLSQVGFTGILVWANIGAYHASRRRVTFHLIDFQGKRNLRRDQEMSDLSISLDLA